MFMFACVFVCVCGLPTSCSFIDEELDVLSSRINTVSSRRSAMEKYGVIMGTHVLGGCVWQSVYCAWKSCVRVGPTIWYSSVPTMHQLCVVSAAPPSKFDRVNKLTVQCYEGDNQRQR
jgi:hypothetical protein